MQEARRSRRARCSWVRAARRGHRRQRGQQWHAGLQPQQHLHLRRADQRCGRRYAIGQRRHGPDRQQYLHWRHHDHGGHLAAGRGRGWIHGRRHRRRRDQQRQPACQSQQYLYAGRGHQRHGLGHAAGQRHHGPDGRQYLHRRHHDHGGRLAAGRGRHDGQHRRQREQQRRVGLQSERYLHLRRDHQRHGIGHAAGQRHHHPDRQQYLHWRHHG